MGNFGLGILPGMAYGGQYLRYAYLCVFHGPAQLANTNSEHWDPAQHPHLALIEEKTRWAPRNVQSSFNRPRSYWKTGTQRFFNQYVFPPEFVAEKLDSNSMIWRAMRQMELEVLHLNQISFEDYDEIRHHNCL